jgi:hypothetical protein
MRDRPPGLLPWIFARQSDYPTDLLRGESGGLPAARFIDQNLLDEPCKNTLIIIIIIAYLLSGFKTR